MKLNRGFLLVEVLVALSVLLIGLILISRSFGISLRAVAYSKYYLIATTLLEKKAIDCETKDDLEDGKTNGVFSENEDFSWIQKVTDLDTDSGLKKVELSVSWQKGERNSGNVSLVTYVIKR